MRLPVSAWLWRSGVEGARGGVFSWVVGDGVGPGAPEDSDPGAGEDAHGVGVIAAARAGAFVDVCGPLRGVSGIVGEACDGRAQALVAGPAPADAAGFSAGVSDRRDAGLGGELVFALEAGAHVAELGRNLGRADFSRAREAHDDASFGQFCDVVFDARGELGDLRHETFQGARQRPHELALGFGFRLAGASDRCGAQACEHVLGRAAPAILVLGEEGGDALFAEPLGALRRGIAVEEGKRDGRGDVGEQRRRARPEAVEQCAQLIGERDFRRHQVVASAHQRAQRFDGVGLRLEGAETMAVGPQDVGEDIGVAPLVSCGLLKSERARRSRRRPGTNAFPAKLSQRHREVA